MSAASFITRMNGLQQELERLPSSVADALCRLMELVDMQNASISTLLAVNQKLLDERDRRGD